MALKCIEARANSSTLRASNLPKNLNYVYNPLFEDKGYVKENTKGLPASLDGFDFTQWRSSPIVDEDDMTPPKRVKALKRGQEKDLFLHYNCLKHRYNQVTHSGKISKLGELYEKIQDARSKIVQSNMALVLSVVKRSKIPYVDFGELISEGNVTLLRCVEKFDVSRGFKFSTYAYGAILRTFHRLANKSEKYHSRFPTDFDPQIDVPDPHKDHPGENKAHTIELLKSAVWRGPLSTIEKAILAARFGLAGNRSGTFREIGQTFELSPERIRQIQDGVLDKLREYLDSRI